jgi:hypothetical protein
MTRTFVGSHPKTALEFWPAGLVAMPSSAMTESRQFFILLSFAQFVVRPGGGCDGDQERKTGH